MTAHFTTWVFGVMKTDPFDTPGAWVFYSIATGLALVGWIAAQFRNPK